MPASMNLPPPLSRRAFLDRALLAAGLFAGPAAATLHALEPLHRAGRCRLELSLAAYSFRDFFNRPEAEKSLTVPGFIDFCADHGCAGTELTSYYFPKNFTDAYLIELKRHAFLRGVAVSGTAVGNNFALPDGPARDQQVAQVKAWVDHAAVLGAPHIRVFAGEPKGLDKAAGKRQCVRALEECGEYAGTKGIWLGLENHGGIVSEVTDLLDIVQAVKSPWVGVNLDTGNFFTDADPYAEMARLAPYAVNVQLKVAISRRGQPKQPTELAKVIEILRQANYQGYVALEYEESDPWGEVPVWLKRMREAFANA